VIYVPLRGPRRLAWDEAEAVAEAKGMSLSAFVSDAVETAVRKFRREEAAKAARLRKASA
jgi:hypothetical protein